MVNYRRDYTSGATYFFTLTLQDRRSTYLTTYSALLGKAFRNVREQYGFNTKAIVVLPDHLHFIWHMAETEHDYSIPIRLIKTQFTKSLLSMAIPLAKNARGDVNLWQKRFWEHRIRNEEDLQKHVDYVHYNPVKHGYVNKAVDWSYSSIHFYIKNGILKPDWGS